MLRKKTESSLALESTGIFFRTRQRMADIRALWIAGENQGSIAERLQLPDAIVASILDLPSAAEPLPAGAPVIRQHLEADGTGPLVETALAQAFPDTSFTVSSVSVSSIEVAWTNGPSVPDVSILVTPYQDVVDYSGDYMPIRRVSSLDGTPTAFVDFIRLARTYTRLVKSGAQRLLGAKTGAARRNFFERMERGGVSDPLREASFSPQAAPAPEINRVKEIWRHSPKESR